MSFGVLAAWQGWLLACAAAAAAAALFLLRVRPPRVAVSSLVLWRRVLDDPREQTWWERVRRAVSLAVTMLVALALVLAALRIGTDDRNTSKSSGRVHIVLDTSWSMAARTASGETRWDRAILRARQIARDAGGPVSVATTSDGPVVGATADSSVIESILDGLTPGGRDALLWPAAGDGTIHFITDGGTARQLPHGLVIHSVFEPAPNVAITAFEARRSVAGAHAGDAYLEVANFATVRQQVQLSVRRGNASLMDRQVQIAAGERLRQAFRIREGEGELLQASISAEQNALRVDDRADARVAMGRPLNIGLVGKDVSWLSRLFSGNPATRTTTLDPGAFRGPGGADILIFDRWMAPEEDLTDAAPSLSFAPPIARGLEERRPRWLEGAGHPVTRGVDPLTLVIERAWTYTLRGFTPVARSATGTPLVYVADDGKRRQVLVTFGPDESNLTSVPAFPVLVGNAIEWLIGPVNSHPRHPGVTTFSSDVRRVKDSEGRAVPIAHVDAGATAILRDPGVHVIEGGRGEARVPVNLDDPLISDLSRSSLPAGAAQTERAAARAGSARWWMYCALIAFTLVLLEWWTWGRRITV